MSGKFLARASALSLAVILAACGGDDSSTPLVDTGNNPPPPTGGDGSDDSSTPKPGVGDDASTGDDNDTITQTFQVGSFDSSGNFQKGKIRVDTPVMVVSPALSEQAHTRLRLAILNDESELDTNGHTVELVSTCTTDVPGNVATIDTTGSTATGKVIADYTTSKGCFDALKDGKDTIIATFNGDSSLRASTEISLSPYEFVIGSVDDFDTFHEETLHLSSGELDYNKETNPTTTFSTAVGMYDAEGTYTGLLQGVESKIEFYSTCINSGLATIESTGATSTGELISSYTANGCVGSDTIYARIEGTQDTASATVNILPPKGQKLTLGHYDDSGSFNPEVIGNTRSTALPLKVQTKLYLSIADAATEAQIKGQPLTVSFNSRCGEQPGAISSPLSTSNVSVNLGYIEVLYTAQSCGELDNDLVRAELTGVEGYTAIAETEIKLAELPANSLMIDDLSSNSIAPAWYSTQDRETTSTLQVQLKDSQNNGVGGEKITFTLDNPDDVDVAVLDPVDGGLTSSDGYAEVKIKALEGFDNVVFRVIASYTGTDGNLLQTYSAPIAVNSKLPHEDRFSLSTSNFAPDTQGKNGVQVPLTLQAADDQGNRIRGNTVVNFKTDIGSIEPECLLDDEGRCTVTWESLDINENFAEVTAYTHGRLVNDTTGEINSKVRMLMTTSNNVSVDLIYGGKTPPEPEGSEFCAEAYVDLDGTGTKYAPPVGTKMEFEVENGKLIPESSDSYTLGSSSSLLDPSTPFVGCTFVEPLPEADREGLVRLTVTVTPSETAQPIVRTSSEADPTPAIP